MSGKGHRDYWDQLRDLSRTVGNQAFGMDISMADQQTRIILAIVGAAFSVLIKALIDKGVLTEDDFNAGWMTAAQAPWDREPDNPPGPPRDHGNGPRQ